MEPYTVSRTIHTFAKSIQPYRYFSLPKKETVGKPPLLRTDIATTAVLLFFPLFSIFAQYPAQIKVITYNINAQGHGSNSYNDIAEVINELDPTIAGLQKIDSCNSRNPLYVAQWLGEQTTMYHTFAPALKNFQGGDGSYGVAFLSDEEPLSERRLWIEGSGSEEDRGVLEITVTMGGEPVRLIVTHLAHEGTGYRTSQIETILPWIDNGGTSLDPVIIMADFNAGPSESPMKLFENAGFVYVKGKDGVILDTTNGINHILYRPENRWKVIDAGNPVYGASNRNPVWVDIELLDTTSVAAYQVPGNNRPVCPECRNGELRYHLNSASFVSLYLVNTAGRMVRRIISGARQGAGHKKIILSDFRVSSGTYYGVLTINGHASVPLPIVLQ